VLESDQRERSQTSGARSFLDERRPPTPCLVVDTDVVAERAAMFTALFPGAKIRYAVKANPAMPVLRTLVAAGIGFDVASPAEIDDCLSSGADPADLVYSNTIKKATDIAFAYGRGVREFNSDSIGDIESLAVHAPGSTVSIRLLLETTRSVTPFGRKFGCHPDDAHDLLSRAAHLGLRPGIAFHVGSQQLAVGAWQTGIATAGRLVDALESDSVVIDRLNIGGGFPGEYLDGCPPLADIAASIEAALARAFPRRRPDLMMEPGRGIVGPAGTIRTEVVLVNRRPSNGGTRWVYLDIGRYNGLAETENEAIAYRLEPVQEGGASGPVILAGPTCDGDDIIYQRRRYDLPLALAAGDTIDILETGAYTASYSSVSFNGIAPLRVHCIGTFGDPDQGLPRRI
jgi:ornithine decarboxylase